MKTYTAKTAATYLKSKMGAAAPAYTKLVRWYNATPPKKGPRCTWETGKPTYSQSDLDAWVKDRDNAPKPEPRPQTAKKHGGGRRPSKPGSRSPAVATAGPAALPGDLAAIRRMVEREEEMQSIVTDLVKLLKRLTNLYGANK